MTEPIVFISHFRIRAGMFEAYARLQQDVLQHLRAEKPRTLAFVAYADESRSRLTIVHLFADAAAMDAHFEGADERARAAYEFLVPDGWEVYGAPSRAAAATLQDAASSSGVRLTVEPAYVDGFLRLATA